MDTSSSSLSRRIFDNPVSSRRPSNVESPGRRMSASIINVRFPDCAKATARFDETVVLPSPGSVLVQTKRFVSCGENSMLVRRARNASTSFECGFEWHMTAANPSPCNSSIRGIIDKTCVSSCSLSSSGVRKRSSMMSRTQMMPSPAMDPSISDRIPVIARRGFTGRVERVGFLGILVITILSLLIPIPST